jgi:hypothetical protein
MFIAATSLVEGFKGYMFAFKFHDGPQIRTIMELSGPAKVGGS